MRPEAATALAGQLLTTIHTGTSGADHCLNGAFRRYRWGPRERALVGDLVYGVLRHGRRLAARYRTVIPDPTPPFSTLAACFLAEREAWPTVTLCHFLGASPPVDLPVPIPEEHLTSAERFSLPDWLWQAWATQWGTEQAGRLALALNDPPSVDLRINRLKGDRITIQQTLAAEGIATEPTPHAPDGLRLSRRIDLTRHPTFKAGLWEIQDEGSQRIAPLLKPRPGGLFIDLCAGAGGKSLHLAALMGDRGRVVAVDHDPRRLNRLKARQQRAGVHAIERLPVRHEGDPKLRRYTGAAEGVLVDAPCSGTGTLRRQPEIKSRLTADQIPLYQQRQIALLEAGARLVKKGGRLVYATCSLLAQENQEVVALFQKSQPGFTLSSVTEGDERLPPARPFLTLLPHETGSDGFFAAVFLKKS